MQVEGRAIRAVTEGLYRRWLEEAPAPAAASAEASGMWPEDWIAMADEMKG